MTRQERFDILCGLWMLYVARRDSIEQHREWYSDEEYKQMHMMTSNKCKELEKQIRNFNANNQ